jgi:hypothetical protein
VFSPTLTQWHLKRFFSDIFRRKVLTIVHCLAPLEDCFPVGNPLIHPVTAKPKIRFEPILPVLFLPLSVHCCLAIIPQQYEIGMKSLGIWKIFFGGGGGDKISSSFHRRLTT